MHQQIIAEIGSKIRKIRKEKGLTVQNVAERASVSKGLISRIENNRTIPSLPVLIAIIKAVETDIADFFEDIDSANNDLVILKRANDLQADDSNELTGLTTFPILNKNLSDGLLQTSVIVLDPKAVRKNLKQNGYLLKYILEGKISFQINDQLYLLEKGDSVFYDARQSHQIENLSNTKVKFLEVLYLLSSK